MASDGSVIIDTRMDTQGFDRGVANMQKGFNGIGSAIGKIGKVMAGVFAVKQLVQFGKEAIELGPESMLHLRDLTKKLTNLHPTP